MARRIGRSQDEGNRLVVVVSAMGNTTDDLIRQAHTITEKPDERELALLLSTGEIVSCTLVTMALRSLGYRGHRPQRRAGRHTHRYGLHPRQDNRRGPQSHYG